MKQIFSAACIFCMLLISSCLTTDNNGNPTQVLQEFADAIVKNDMLRAKQLSTPESQSILNMLTMAGSIHRKMAEKFDKNKVEFGTAVINGDNASVPVKDRASGQTIQFPLRKINGQWRVSIDAASMMGMAKNKINTTTGGIRDSAKNVLRRINLDPLKKKINNILDSIKIDIP